MKSSNKLNLPKFILNIRIKKVKRGGGLGTMPGGHGHK